jgi:hypothetical protein
VKRFLVPGAERFFDEFQESFIAHPNPFLAIVVRLSGNLLSARGNWALDPETRRPNPD